MDDIIKQKLLTYLDILTMRQKNINLIGNNTIADAWNRHFLDSAQLIDLVNINKANNWIDIGSGAGFPGLVIAIMAPNIQVYLIESTGKKCHFMQEIINVLEIKNATIHHERIENLIPNKHKILPNKIDVISARAVAPLNKLIQYVQPFMAYHTICLFHRGSSAEKEINSKIKMHIQLIPSQTSANSKIVKLSMMR